MSFEFMKLFVGVIATLALYSVLYRENRFYRLVEHIYIGLSVGYAIVALWTEGLEGFWWKPMIGEAPADGTPGTPGFYLYALLIPIGLMGCLVFSKKHGWMSRIPIGIILGFWGGQQLQVWWTEFGPQIQDSMKPLVPTAYNSFTVPNGIALSDTATQQISTASGLSANAVTQLSQNAQLSQDRINAFATANGVSVENVQAAIAQILGKIKGEVYMSQVIGNWVYVITLLSILTYFLFSFEQKGKFLLGFTKLGRWLLMVGFGAIFGSTVMTRFALLIDRMYFVLIEFLKDGLPQAFQR